LLSAFGLAFVSGFGNGWLPDLLNSIKAAILLCPITIVSCGSFGFLAGVGGSSWIYWRRRGITSTRKLLGKSAIAGLLWGVAFPFFDRIVNLPYSESFHVVQLLLCIPSGVTCALICALVFRKRFVA